MATATGFVIGLLNSYVINFLLFFWVQEPALFMSRLDYYIFIGGLLGAIVGFLCYKVSYRHAIPRRRALTEYSYREHMVEESGREIIIRAFGARQAKSLWVDELFEVNSRLEAIRKVLSDRNGGADDNMNFLIYLKIAKSALKADMPDKEQNYLEKAVTIKPNDLVANYRLALSFERSGEGGKAIKSYEAALKDASIDSPDLKVFIMSQIQRVKAHGPRKRSRFWGARYLFGS